MNKLSWEIDSGLYHRIDKTIRVWGKFIFKARVLREKVAFKEAANHNFEIWSRFQVSRENLLKRF